MLLFQGVEAFEIWTGRDAPVDAMNAALRDAL
jgi:shikimate dehydrogenase